MKKSVDTNQKAIDKLNRKNPASSQKITSGSSLNVKSAASGVQQNVDPQQNGIPLNSDKDPGRTLGIISLVFSLGGIIFWGFTAVPGMILGLIAYFSSRKAGYTNGYAIAGAIVGFLISAVSIGFIIYLFSNDEFREALEESDRQYDEQREIPYWDYNQEET